MVPDLGKIYDDHAPALFRFLLNLTRSEAEAADILQNVFVKLACRPAVLDEVRDLRPWLLRMSHRQAIDEARRRIAHENAVEKAAETVEIFAPADDPDGDAFRAEVAQAMAELPEDQR